MNSRNPFNLGPIPEGFVVPEGYVGGQWIE